MRQDSEERVVFLGLLLSLVALMLIPGLFANTPYADVLTLVLFSLVLMTAVAATSRRRIAIWSALLLALPAVGLRWMPRLGLGHADVIALSTALLLILLSGGSILATVLRQRRVTQDTLYGSVCVYLLMGVAWAIVYGLVELRVPGSFVQNNQTLVIDVGAEAGVSNRLIYFSMVTMTTLGYGDITPVRTLAQRLAVLEAMTGQLYVAITVARLVALQVSHAREA